MALAPTPSTARITHPNSSQKATLVTPRMAILIQSPGFVKSALGEGLEKRFELAGPIGYKAGFRILGVQWIGV